MAHHRLGLCLLAGFALLASACGGPPPVSPSPAAAAPSSRPSEIPPVGVLTLATRDDMSRADTFAFDVSIQKAVNDYLANPGQRWTLHAARPAGDFVLLWIGFPGIADGGADLVYSTKEKQIKWEFKGGERG